MTKKKSPLKSAQAHVSKTKLPMGDFYGPGVRQNVGKNRSDFMGDSPVSPKKLKVPPKKLA